MNPWLWFWSPQFHFPWSGAVSQRIEPRTAWYAEHIPAGAGDAEMEAKVTELASYGKQLGLLTEALIGVAERAQPTSPVAITALERLKALQASIEALKQQEHASTAERLVQEVQALRRRGGAEFEGLARALVPLLSAQASG